MTTTMEGRVAIITGSAAGIGAAIARELSSRGASIILSYPFPKMEETCKEVGNSLKTPWIAVCADLSTAEGPTQLVAAAVSEFKYIDILVHNAAHFGSGLTEALTAESWDITFAVNVRGTFLLTQAVLPHLRPYTFQAEPPLTGTPGGSRIICISSGSCRAPQCQPNVLAYAATKGAVETMIKVWARELTPVYGCTVNGVSPGPTNTEAMLSLPGFNAEVAHQAFGSATPCEGSLADPEDISSTVAFLAEPKTKWINGEIIMVNGGLITI
ncbi:short-chain dehydrogenase [Ilyonectria robusta]